MESSVRFLSTESQFEDTLYMLVEQSYLCVADKKGILRGISTRKAMLKRVNYMAHEFERIYDVRFKEEYRSQTEVDDYNIEKFSRQELLRGRAD